MPLLLAGVFAGSTTAFEKGDLCENQDAARWRGTHPSRHPLGQGIRVAAPNLGSSGRTIRVGQLLTSAA